MKPPRKKPRTLVSASEPQVEMNEPEGSRGVSQTNRERDDATARNSRARDLKLTVQAEQRQEEQRRESDAANRVADEEDIREQIQAQVSSTISLL